MTRQELAGVLAYLSSAVGKPVPNDQAAVYYDLLGDLPAEAVKLAAQRALLESRYPVIPPVGTLRALATEILRDSQGEQELPWPDAWRRALAAVATYGLARPRDALASLPDAVRDAVEAIGWQSLCDADPADLGTLRAQFRDAYGVLREREERARLLPPRLRDEAARLLGQIRALPAPE